MKSLGFMMLALVMLSIIQNAFAASLLETLLFNSYIETTQYQTPTPSDLQNAQQLFEAILKNRVINPEDSASWNNLGFSIRSVKEGGNDFAVISETAKGYGHGFYVIRLTGPKTQNVLQAPHRLSDLYTHQIIYKMLITGDYIAAAWNTAKRTNVDLCKETSSYFNAFTIAVGKVFDMPKIIQLHAFDVTNHGIKGDLILSASKKQHPPIYNQVATCLKGLNSSLPFIILQYPEDTQQLGGLLNINAKNFYKVNPNGMFFHLETSKRLRLLLRDEQNLRDHFSKCFAGI